MKRNFLLILSLMLAFMACKEEVSDVNNSSKENVGVENDDPLLIISIYRGTRKDTADCGWLCCGKSFCIDISTGGIVTGGDVALVSNTENIVPTSERYYEEIYEDSNGDRTMRIPKNYILPHVADYVFENHEFEMDHNYVFPSWVQDGLPSPVLAGINMGVRPVLETPNYYQFNLDNL